MVWWLGGTGFVFKTPAGTQVFVDPYFSNCVAAIFGVERFLKRVKQFVEHPYVWLTR